MWCSTFSVVTVASGAQQPLAGVGALNGRVRQCARLNETAASRAGAVVART